MSEDDGRDVKRWLGSALAGEPPLRIDRDEVLRRGRRGVRNRRLVQAGGASTGVVAAVVGTVLFTGLLTTDGTVPPASTRTTDHPASATTMSPPSSVSVTTSEPNPPSASPQVDENSDRLRDTLISSGLLPENAKLAALPGHPDTPTFRLVHDRTYLLSANVLTPDAEGWLSVRVELPPEGWETGATCDVPEVRFDSCSVREEYGMPITVAVRKLRNGELRLWVRAVRRDGALVTAISSNTSKSGRAKDDEVGYDQPTVLSEKKLIAIVALPELTLD